MLVLEIVKFNELICYINNVRSFYVNKIIIKNEDKVNITKYDFNKFSVKYVYSYVDKVFYDYILVNEVEYTMQSLINFYKKELTI